VLKLKHNKPKYFPQEESGKRRIRVYMDGCFD